MRASSAHHVLSLSPTVCLNAEDVPEGRTDFKCCPPVRNKANREKLWDALIAGDIDFVVSDHSPCVVELKMVDTGDFNKAWGGIGGLGLGLSLMHTQARSRNIGLPKLMQWLALKPAQQIGLQGKKGSLQVGADADFVLFDPSIEFTVSGARFIPPRARNRTLCSCRLSFWCLLAPSNRLIAKTWSSKTKSLPTKDSGWSAE